MTSLIQNSVPAIPNAHQTVESLATSRLPNNSLITVYLQSRLVTLKDTKTGESYKACCISLMDSLINNKELTLSELIKGKRIGAIHIQDHKVASLILSKEMQDLLSKANVKGVTLIKGDSSVVSVEDNPNIITFKSDDQYKSYVSKLL